VKDIRGYRYALHSRHSPVTRCAPKALRARATNVAASASLDLRPPQSVRRSRSPERWGWQTVACVRCSIGTRVSLEQKSPLASGAKGLRGTTLNGEAPALMVGRVLPLLAR
jgi:hypothetical protein